MFGAMQQDKVDGLVVCHNDPVHRQQRELEDFIYLVDATDIAVGTVTTAVFNLGTASGRMTARILGAAKSPSTRWSAGGEACRTRWRRQMDLAGYRGARAANERKVQAVRETLARSVEEEALQRTRADAVDLQARWDGLHVEERRGSSGRW